MKENSAGKNLFRNPYLITLVKILIGLAFITSAVSKLMSLGQFEISLIQQHIFKTRITAAYSARLLIIIELVLGIAFFQKSFVKKFILPFTIFLLVVFTCHLSYLALFTDFNENCGCFGNLIKMTPVESIIKNAVLLAGCLFLYRSIDKDLGKKPIFLFGCALSSLLVVIILFPVKIITNSNTPIISNNGTKEFSNDNKASPQKKTDPSKSRFRIFNRNGIEENEIQITSGHCIAAFLSLDCDHCKEVARELIEIPYEFPIKIYCIFLGELDQVPIFFEETGTSFPYVISPESDFFDFIGNSPPRLYSLYHGDILKFWDLETYSIGAVIKHLDQFREQINNE